MALHLTVLMEAVMFPLFHLYLLISPLRIKASEAQKMI
jgi:hypothetical protein